jgi:hypothetical protein
MKRLVLLTILLLFSLSSCSGIPQTGAGHSDGLETPGIGHAVFPLTPGTCWTYEGTVKWTEGAEVKEKTVLWQMEVVESNERGDVTGYHMKGHPRELIGYQEGKEPADYAILRVGPNKFYYANLQSYQRLLDENDDLAGLIREEDLFLELPLKEGKRFCETEQILREDGMNCWVTGKGEPVQMKKVAGLALPVALLEYPVLKARLPDHMSVGFTPGVGITNFKYIHHGTTFEVDLILSEFEVKKLQE